MESQPFTRVQAFALALLRVLIGWHFLYEGVAKLLKPNWSASGLLLQARGPLTGLFHWIAGSPQVLEVVNQMNIYGLILIGLGLMLGCFTRTAGWAGLLLILLYYFCNPPFVGFFYSLPSEGNYLIVNKNLVEAAALFVTITARSGRFLGFDQILHRLFSGKAQKVVPPQSAANQMGVGK
jgi:thiosulfate dehydrogenase (quinone) large subunit